MAIKRTSGKVPLKPSYAYLIEKKRDGHEFTEDEVRNIVDSILDDEMPDFQMAALVMAIFFKDMAAQETAVFADEMILTGETIELSDISRPKVAKYSTGGVGDKTSIILSAIGAACGVVVPGMSSPDEDFVLTVHNKLSSVPGFKTKLSLSDFHKQLSSIGCAICEHDDSIAPVDAKIYKMRHATATIPSLPLITASVLSKKFAVGSDGLVVDVKWGNGSFLRDIEQAKQLARTITRVARVMKHRCVALVTDMNQPLGNCVGMGLEVMEALDFLRGNGTIFGTPVIGAATLQPGASLSLTADAATEIGTLNFANGVTLSEESVLEFQIALGYGGDVEHDAIAVRDNTLVLDGWMDVLCDLPLAKDDVFPVLSFEPTAFENRGIKTRRSTVADLPDPLLAIDPAAGLGNLCFPATTTLITIR